MKYFAALAALPAVLGQTCQNVHVTVNNLMWRQVLSPGVIVAHSPDAELFSVGTAASNELREIALNGDPTAMVTWLQSDAVDPLICGFNQTSYVSAIAARTQSTSQMCIVSPVNKASCNCGNMVWSYVAMPISTNDGIVGVRNHALTTYAEKSTVNAAVYDAGVEDNTANDDSNFNCNSFPGPLGNCLSLTMGNNNNHNPPITGAGEGLLHPHRGHELTEYDWSDNGPVRLEFDPQPAPTSNNNWLWLLLFSNGGLFGGHHH